MHDTHDPLRDDQWTKCVKKLTLRLKRGFPTLDHDDAESAAQEAVVQAHRENPTHPIERLDEIAYFPAINALRADRAIHLNGRARQRPRPLKEPIPAKTPTPTETLFDHPALTDPQRTVLRLKYESGDTFKTIGEQLGLSPSDTKHLHDEAIKTLKRVMTAGTRKP